MPVTINGNGSITGLSVGGLPNGTVDADTLATNSVTTVKIADGAATDVKQGAGSVVQMQNVTISNDNTREYTTTGSWLDNYSTTNQYQRIDFTPKFSNSKLLILAAGTTRYVANSNGQAGYAQVRIIDATNSNTTVGYIKYAMYAYTGGHNRDSGAWTCMAYINASSTSLRRYTCQYYFDGAQTYYVGNEGDSITVMEIKV